MILMNMIINHHYNCLFQDGSGDESYFSPDCFHFSAKGHALGAKEIWNNMVNIPVVLFLMLIQNG